MQHRLLLYARSTDGGGYIRNQAPSPHFATQHRCMTLNASLSCTGETIKLQAKLFQGMSEEFALVNQRGSMSGWGSRTERSLASAAIASSLSLLASVSSSLASRRLVSTPLSSASLSLSFASARPRASCRSLTQNWV